MFNDQMSKIHFIHAPHEYLTQIRSVLFINNTITKFECYINVYKCLYIITIEINNLFIITNANTKGLIHKYVEQVIYSNFI